MTKETLVKGLYSLVTGVVGHHTKAVATGTARNTNLVQDWHLR